METIQATIQVNNQHIAERIETFINASEYEDGSVGFGGRVTIFPANEEEWAALGVDPAYKVSGNLTVLGWVAVGKIIGNSKE